MTSLSFAAVMFFSSLSGAYAGAFRGSSLNVTTGSMRTEDVRGTMLDELMAALGDGNRITKRRLQDIEEAVSPMFLALPKNEHGNLDHSAARYALHRLFVLRHGMFVKGLEPGGAGWSGAGSPAEILDDLVPSYVQSLFEERMDGRGLGLHELSVLAATLEHLVHDEAVARLRTAYEAHGASLDSRLPNWKVEGIVDTFMVLFLQGISAGNASRADIEDILEKQGTIHEVFPSWHESQQFTREVQTKVVSTHASESDFDGSLSFNASATIIEEIVERYGRWQDGECRDLKASLVKLEDSKSGRVPLKDFYGSALDGAWQFTESQEYLRDLGALDETAAGQPSVIIPNYINSHSNCVASSSIFSVCCLNECEPLLSHLEREIAAPDAAPERLLELVERLPSTSVQAPRSLPQELKDLLLQVASHHDGTVPLHGRLFAQWLHHAYPRECPYPHKAGTTNPMTADEWIGSNASRTTQASMEEMKMHIQSVSTSSNSQTADCKDPKVCSQATAGGSNSPAAEGKASLLWTAEEELVAPVPASRNSRGIWKTLAMGAAVVALAISLARSAGTMLMGRKGDKYRLPLASKSHLC